MSYSANANEWINKSNIRPLVDTLINNRDKTSLCQNVNDAYYT